MASMLPKKYDCRFYNAKNVYGCHGFTFWRSLRKSDLMSTVRGCTISFQGWFSQQFVTVYRLSVRVRQHSLVGRWELADHGLFIYDSDLLRGKPDLANACIAILHRSHLIVQFYQSYSPWWTVLSYITSSKFHNVSVVSSHHAVISMMYIIV